MIIEFFIDIWESLCTWFISLFGTDDAPAWLSQLSGMVHEMYLRASGLGAWFPFALLGTVIGSYVTTWLVIWLVKGVRWLWGLTPFSGGS